MREPILERSTTRIVLLVLGTIAGVVLLNVFYELPGRIVISPAVLVHLGVYVICGGALVWGLFLVAARRRELSPRSGESSDVSGHVRRCVRALDERYEPIRLSAIYELRDLARTQRLDAEVATSMLEAFLRGRTGLDKLDELDGFSGRTDTEAALRVLAELASRIERPVQLPGVDLRFADLAGLDLTGFQLRGSQLDGANLTGAVLAKADLSGSSLARVTAVETTLHGAMLNRTVFVQARLVEADLNRILGIGIDFRDADLSGADLTGATMVDADFGMARMRGANLTGARVINSNFAGSDLIDARFKGASFDGYVNFADARARPQTLVGAKIRSLEALPPVEVSSLTDLGATVGQIPLDEITGSASDVD